MLLLATAYYCDVGVVWPKIIWVKYADPVALIGPLFIEPLVIEYWVLEPISVIVTPLGLGALLLFYPGQPQVFLEDVFQLPKWEAMVDFSFHN